MKGAGPMTTLTEPVVIENPFGGWNVEQFDEDGGCLVTNFTGPEAERRAREYADWIGRQPLQPTNPEG